MKSEMLPSGDYAQEYYDAVMARYSGFGKNLYQKLRDMYPDVFFNLTFYRRIDYQVEDSYAVFVDGDSFFVIQLDPLCEVIVLWSKLDRIEIGSWSHDEYSEAMAFITDQLSQRD